MAELQKVADIAVCQIAKSLEAAVERANLRVRLVQLKIGTNEIVVNPISITIEVIGLSLL